MSNFSPLSPDDPRLTAFALGELEGEDLAAVEAALRDDPAARAAVAEIRIMAGQLESALGAEPMLESGPAAVPLRSVAILPGRDPAKLDGGSLAKLINFPKLRFPQLYFLVGGLAAAAFAVLVIRQQPADHAVHQAEKKSYTAVNLQSAPAGGEAKVESERTASPNAPAMDKLAVPAPDQKRDEPAATVAVPVSQEQAALNAPAQSNLLKAMPQVSGLSTANQTHGSRGARLLDDGVAGNISPAKEMQVAAKDADELKATVSENEADRRQLTAATGQLRVDLAAAPRASLKVQRSPVAPGSRAKIETGATYGVGADRPGQGPSFGADANSLPFAGQPSGGRAKTLAHTEAYAYQRDNDFLGAAENPLSTFSIDVDTASYANVRRFLAQGQLPPVDAVRIEELVNYFPYHYAAPGAGKTAAAADKTEGLGRSKTAPLQSDEVNGAPFAASMEVADAPWAPGHRLVRIGLKGREVSTAARPAANLVFLLDVSGSMDEPNKLPLVKESMRLLLGKLRPDDRVAIVVYAGASGLALPSTPVAQVREILAALDALEPGGSTNGAMGIQLAYDIAKANFVPGGLNRVILCTDGDFNVGVTSEGDLTRLIKEKAKSGVFLTVLGFGMGNYKDATLEKLADQGNGNYGYIDSRREAEKLLVEQVSGTLVTIAKDVKLQVEFNSAQVASYRLIGYENRLLKKEDFNNDAVDAGEIGAGHTVTALYEIVPISLARGEGRGARGVPAVDELKYGAVNAGQNRKSPIEKRNSQELLTLKVRFKEPAGAVSRKLEFPLVDRGGRFADASADFKFAAAVAEFGMILRGSPHKGTGTLGDVQTWAEAGTDSDAGGYRGEFIKLVKQAEALLR